MVRMAQPQRHAKWRSGGKTRSTDAFLFACGLILDTVTKGRQETKLLHYLNAERHPQ